MRGERSLRSERGQTLVLVAVALVVLIGFLAVVVDSGLAYAEKRKLQIVADAAALAAVQDVAEALVNCDVGDAACREGYRPSVKAVAEAYSADNGGPATLPECDAGTLTNCYTWPYPDDSTVSNYGRVEVRIGSDLDAFFAGLFGFTNPFFKPRARAVAAADAITESSCNFDEPPAEPDPLCVQYAEPIVGEWDPGEDAWCEFPEWVENPELYPPPDCLGPYFYEDGVDGAVAFVMSRSCGAILYTGAGGGQIGSFVTNGGLDFQGANPKKVRRLGFNRTGCPDDPPSPPSNTSECTATIWGDSTDSNNSCVKDFTDFSHLVPMTWPVRRMDPFVEPIAKNLWTPSAHWPTRCMDLGTASITFTPSATHTATSGPPGVYCLTGANQTLNLNGDFSTGAGYTFFALNGSKIHLASNGTRVKFYWPTGCGDRPENRLSAYSCFDRTMWSCSLSASGPCYEPQTMLYATWERAAADPTSPSDTCAASAICIDGQSVNLDGDLYAMEPYSTVPANPTTIGATVWIAGGNAFTGKGFIQSWWITFQGNTGHYTGTGMGIGGQLQQVQGILHPSEDAHCVFDPPLDPEEYPDPPTTPPCEVPGGDPLYGTYETTIVDADIGMDE